jgi:two-component system LytT family response regulator
MSARYRVIVVDDEPLARNGVVALLGRDEEIDVVADVDSGEEAIAAIRDLAPHIVFLDIEMPGMSGFDVLASLADLALPAIVFVTAFNEFAVRAFEVHAVDYLLKPFDDDRFTEAVARAKRQVLEAADGGVRARLMALLATMAEEPGAPGGGARPVARLIVRETGLITFVPTSDIDWIEAASYYAKLHVNRRVHMLRESLSSLEARLDPALFLRIHRSAIVNLERVQSVAPKGKGEGVVQLKDGTRLKLSRGRIPELEERIQRMSAAR